MSNKPKYCFLINNASNASRAGEFVQSHKKQIKDLFPDSEFIFIQKDDAIADIARENANSHKHIIACGGDGTVNQVVNGIIGKDVILGVLPLGSGNDFAKSIGLTKGLTENLKTLKAENISHIDVVKFDWGCFINTFGIGLDGLTNLYASESPFSHGLLRYFWGGLKALYSAKPFGATITLNESTEDYHYRCWMVAIANGKNEGGRYTISPDSVNYDGKLEVVVVKDISKIRLTYEFLKLSFGIPFNKKIADVLVTENGGKIVCDSQVKTHADGEQRRTCKVNEFNLLKGAINVISNF